jgi:DNA-binding CsgD family transcriptional regulator
MEFKNEELVEREMEIACYLLQDFSLNQIALKIGLNKKILTAHLRNMMEKLRAADMDELIKLIMDKEQNKQTENLPAIDHILKNKIMKHDKKFLLIISLMVLLTGMVVFFFSIKFFKGLYENMDHFEYVSSRPMR